MLTFFLLLGVLMVLVVAAGSWMGGGARRRVIHERGPTVVDRRPIVVDEFVEVPVESIARTRRVIRRRRTY